MNLTILPIGGIEMNEPIIVGILQIVSSPQNHSFFRLLIENSHERLYDIRKC